MSDEQLSQAFDLQYAGRLEEAVEAYGAVADRLAGSTEPEVRRDIARALLQQAHVLDTLDRVDEAAAARQRAVELAGEVAQPSAEDLSDGLHEAEGLIAAKRYEEAIFLLSDLTRLWGFDPPEAVAELVAHATVWMAQTSMYVGPNTDAALLTCDEVVAHYGGSRDVGVRAKVAWAMTVKAWVLAGAKRFDEAVATCDAALDYLGDDEHPRLEERREVARSDRARWSHEGSAGAEPPERNRPT